jgi:thiamine-monophosphate kinase
MFTPISDLGEFGLIDRMEAQLGPAPRVVRDRIVRGLGDDAAVVRVGEGRVHVITTDALIEGVHFDRTMTTLTYLGIKAVAVNVSDVAAMNATPRYLTLALGVPETMSVEMIEELYEGVRQACALYGCALIGGDTTGASALTISVTAIGEAEESAVVYRSGARVGELVCVSGEVGGAYAGLRVLLGHRRAQQEEEGYQADLSHVAHVIKRQLVPTARLDIVEAFAAVGIRPSACIDVSDGVASEIHHVCEASGVGAMLEVEALPMHAETRYVAGEVREEPDAFALFGGEDYELLFTCTQDDFDKLPPDTATVIGTITDREEGVRIRSASGETIPLRPVGYAHFG